MKKLIPLIMPLVIVSFLMMTIKNGTAGEQPTLPPQGTTGTVFMVVKGVKVPIYTVDVNAIMATNPILNSNGYYVVTNTVEIDADGLIYPNTPSTNINTTGNSGLFFTQVTSPSAIASNLLSVTYQSLGYTTNDVNSITQGYVQSLVATPKACIGWVIGVLVLVVAGIIIYLLIKTCKKCLK